MEIHVTQFCVSLMQANSSVAWHNVVHGHALMSSIELILR
jgi:hypothetical protein